MVLLPLLLIWLRDPMYFNAPSRWAVVVLAVAAGVVAPQTLSDPPSANSSSAAAAESSSLAEPHHSSAGGGSQEPTAQDPSLASEFSNKRESRALSDRQAAPAQARLREGTRLPPTLGRFTQVDGGWLFQSEGTPAEALSTAIEPADTAADAAENQAYQLRVLENLTLQRVAQVIQQDPADNRWLVSGMVTEYFGENRLIISAAVRAATVAETMH